MSCDVSCSHWPPFLHDLTTFQLGSHPCPGNYMHHMMSQTTKSHFNPHFCKNLKISFTFFTLSNNKVNKTVCYQLVLTVTMATYSSCGNVVTELNFGSYDKDFNYTKSDNVLHIKFIFIKLKKNVAGRKTAPCSTVEYKTPYKSKS